MDKAQQLALGDAPLAFIPCASPVATISQKKNLEKNCRPWVLFLLALDALTLLAAAACVYWGTKQGTSKYTRVFKRQYQEMLRNAKHECPSNAACAQWLAREAGAVQKYDIGNSIMLFIDKAASKPKSVCGAPIHVCSMAGPDQAFPEAQSIVQQTAKWALLQSQFNKLLISDCVIRNSTQQAFGSSQWTRAPHTLINFFLTHTLPLSVHLSKTDKHAAPHIVFHPVSIDSPCFPYRPVTEFLYKYFFGLVPLIIIILCWNHSWFSDQPLALTHTKRLLLYLQITLFRYLVLYLLLNKIEKFCSQKFDFSDHIVVSLQYLMLVVREVAAIFQNRTSSRRGTACRFSGLVILLALSGVMLYTIYITARLFHDKYENLVGFAIGALGNFGLFWCLACGFRAIQLHEIGLAAMPPK